MSKENHARNLKLYHDYKRLKKNGRPMLSLVLKYRMSTQTMYTIIKRYEKREKMGIIV